VREAPAAWSYLNASLHTTIQAGGHHNAQTQRGACQLTLLLLSAALPAPALAGAAFVLLLAILLLRRLLHIVLKYKRPIGYHCCTSLLINLPQ
jgi:hypothetical protein